MKNFALIIIGMILVGQLFSLNFPANIQSKDVVQTVNELNRLDISIDKVWADSIRVYVNENQFDYLMDNNYIIQKRRNLAHEYFLQLMEETKDSANPLDEYYTIQEYEEFMENIVAEYPEICHLESMGQSVQGRDLWFMKISDNVNIEENEPEVKLISSIHGDETVGYHCLIKLIDLLTSEYGSDARLTEIVDNTELWINPLMNPDGYALGQRENANNIDLNRHFPDFTTDPVNTQDGREPEIQRVMQFEIDHSSNLAMAFHTGATVINYPWDGIYELAPDNDLIVDLSLTYALNNSMMANSTEFQNGITNGAQWYITHGNMQDWNLYYEKCIELTAELNDVKWPPANELEYLWEQNRESLLLFIEKAQIGIHGLVSNEAGEPLFAEITIENNEQIFLTDPDVGDYHRLLLPDVYSITANAEGYDPKTINDVPVTDGTFTTVNFELIEAQSFDITGRVLNTNNEPIENAEVKLTRIETLISTTDSNGEFLFNSQFEGEYNLNISAENYAPSNQVLNITPTNNYFEVNLSPASFVEDFESGLDNWTLTGNWDLANSNGNNYLADSPDGEYNNNVSSSATLNEAINLTNATYANLFMDLSYSLEVDFDYAFLEISVNQSDWTLLEIFNGSTTWITEQFNLDSYIGNQIYLRFRFESDNWLTEDGINIDNIIVSSDNSVPGNDPITAPSIFSIDQNYPNPFNPITDKETSFIFSSTERSENLSLEIFNLRGQKIFTSPVKARTNKFSWDGKNNKNQICSSGIYFYRLKSDNKTSDLKKIILMH